MATRMLQGAVGKISTVYSDVSTAGASGWTALLTRLNLTERAAPAGYYPISPFDAPFESHRSPSKAPLDHLSTRPRSFARKCRIPVLPVLTFILLNVILLLTLHFPFVPSYDMNTVRYHLFIPPRGSSGPASRLVPRTLVGRRNYTPQQYLTNSCPTMDDYLSAIAQARINEDGPSRKVNWSEPATNELPVPFRFSFELGGGCRQPVWYDTERVCDLLQSFGGVYMRGDSYVRHVWETLLMLVTNSTDGAISNPDHYGDCRGEHMFNDGKVCRWSYFDSIPDKISPCGGLLAGRYSQQEFPREANLSPYVTLLTRRTVKHKHLSPVFYQSDGVHFNFNRDEVVQSYISPLVQIRDRTYPSPLSVWAGLHAPGENIREQFRESQGRDKVVAYNEDIKARVEEKTSGIRFEDGGMRMMEFYNLTEGAESFDGQHYSYQVNMEKVQLLLNILDMTWNDVVQRGGLVDDQLEDLQSEASQGEAAVQKPKEEETYVTSVYMSQ